METFLISTGLIALAEIGDKTQLLAFTLSARYKKPVPIILAILCATLLNHGIAGILGIGLMQAIDPHLLRMILGLSFIVMAIWMMIPDKLPDTEAIGYGKFGIFGTTLIAFFLAEIGDKTQIATISLTAHYANYLIVVLGTTLGMMLANVPIVLAGQKLAMKISMKTVHMIAAVLFGLLGLMTLLGAR